MSDRQHKSHIGIICDTVPYPARSGDNQRIAELISILRARGWFVHLVLSALVDRSLRVICSNNVDALHVYGGIGFRTKLRNCVRRAVRLFDKFGKTFGLPPAEEIASRLLGRQITPIVMNYWQRYPTGLDNFVAKLATRFRWRTVVIEYIWLHRAASKIGDGIVRLLDTHDIQHKRVEEFASRGMIFPLQITRDEEAGIFNQFDAIIAIQAAEAAEIRAMCPRLKVLTVGSMGSNFRKVTQSFVVDGRVLYVGGFNGANIDGLRRFLTTTWPLVRERQKQAHMRVCGYIYRAFLGEEFDQVEFLGHVEDIEVEYAQAAVIVNPSWIGTGLKIKTVETLARGKPLVTTTKGIEGIDSDVEKSTLVCDDPYEFADGVIHLLQDPHTRNDLSEAAKQFAIRHLNAGEVYGELLAYLDSQR